MKVVDLRSDTVTRPTPAMRCAMAEAEVGDDVYGEDPTVQKLEQKVADMFNFEAALFVPSGTMANLIAIMCHCTARDSDIILGDNSHLNLYEQGGSATIAGVHSSTVPNNNDGTMDIRLLRHTICVPDVHCPVTKLICVENTHNYCGGKALPLEYLDKLAALSQETGIPLHMDGARLANAAAYTGVPMSRLLRGFSSSTLCLSKSLGAPVGSLLTGSTSFIEQARRTRKVLGGGMRQVGVLAAAGLVSIDSMIDRLVEDFKHAKCLGRAINECNRPGVSVDLENLHTNIILIELDPEVTSPDHFCTRMAETTPEEVLELGEDNTVSVLMYPMSISNVRMVLHADINGEDVTKVAQKLRFVIGRLEDKSANDLSRDNTVAVE